MDIQLYPPQQRALMSPAQEILYGGAVGGGKSYLARVASIVYSVEIPGLITYLFRRTFKEVLANHIYTPGGYLEMLGELIKAGDVVFSKSDFSFTFWNGSRIQLAHSQYESDIYSHQGAQIGLLIIDEATNFTPDMVRFIRTRVRLGSLIVPDKWKGLFPRILYTANPGGVGHTYFKGGFVDVGAGKQFKAPKDDGGMLREYVPAKLTDNKIMLKTDPDYGERLYGLGNSAMVTAMIDGDWNVVGGGAFSDLWNPNKIVIEPFDIPHTWRIDRGYDYGSSAPGGCCWFAESDGEEHEVGNKRVIWFPRKSIIQFGELYFANAKLEGLNLPAREQGRRIKLYEIDHGIAGRVRSGPADNSIFHKTPGKSSIADDIALEGPTFIRSDKSPGSRIQGVGLMRQRLANSLVGIEAPGYYVTSNCIHTIRTVPNLQRDKNDVEDIDSSQEDHLWDVLRYRILKGNTDVIKKKVVGF
jgi:hypothetical protein